MSHRTDTARQRRTWPIDDAIFTVALQRYLITRLQHGEQATELAVVRLVETARRMGLAPAYDVRLLGFRFTGDVVHPPSQEKLLAALKLVRRHHREQAVQSLCERSLHLSVEQLECGWRR